MVDVHQEVETILAKYIEQETKFGVSTWNQMKNELYWIIPA